jgi:hypothetical protein
VGPHRSCGHAVECGWRGASTRIGSSCRAIDTLPEPIRPFFEASRAFVVERAIDPDLWRNAGFSEEPPNHFVDLDAYGPYPFKELPREPARR